MENKNEKCLLIPEGMADRLGEELKDVYAPAPPAVTGETPVPVPLGKLSRAERKRYAEITAERVTKGGQKQIKTFSVSVKFPRAERELIAKAIKACGYGGVTDWVRTCYKKLLLRQIAIMRAKEEK